VPPPCPANPCAVLKDPTLNYVMKLPHFHSPKLLVVPAHVLQRTFKPVRNPNPTLLNCLVVPMFDVLQNPKPNDDPSPAPHLLGRATPMSGGPAPAVQVAGGGPRAESASAHTAGHLAAAASSHSRTSSLSDSKAFSEAADGQSPQQNIQSGVPINKQALRLQPTQSRQPRRRTS